MYENIVVEPRRECVIMRPYRGSDEILDAEGELDNESEAGDVEMDEFGLLRDSSPNSVTSSIGGEVGSPMMIDDS